MSQLTEHGPWHVGISVCVEAHWLSLVIRQQFKAIPQRSRPKDASSLSSDVALKRELQIIPQRRGQFEFGDGRMAPRSQVLSHGAARQVLQLAGLVRHLESRVVKRLVLLPGRKED